MTKTLALCLAALALLVGFTLVAFAVSSGLFVAGKAVEREALEQSIQYQSAREQEIVTYEAELAAIDAQLAANPNDSGLIAQKNAINIRLRAARARLK